MSNTTNLERTRNAYNHFTLEEWEVIVDAIEERLDQGEIPESIASRILSKCPSAAQ